MRWTRALAAAAVVGTVVAAPDLADAGRFNASHLQILQGDPGQPESSSKASEDVAAPPKKSDEKTVTCQMVNKMKPLVGINAESIMGLANPSPRSSLAQWFLGAAKDADAFKAEGGSEDKVLANVEAASTALKDHATAKIFKQIADKAKNKTVVSLGTDISMTLALQSTAKRLLSVEGDKKKCDALQSAEKSLCQDSKHFEVLCISSDVEPSEVASGVPSSQARIQHHLKQAFKLISDRLGKEQTADLMVINSDFPIAAAYAAFDLLDQSSLLLIRARLTSEANKALSEYYKVVAVVTPKEGQDESKEFLTRVLLRPLFSRGPAKEEWIKYTSEKWRLLDDFTHVVVLKALKEDFKRTHANAIANENVGDVIDSEFNLVKKYIQSAPEDEQGAFDDFLRSLKDVAETEGDFEAAKKVLSDEVDKITKFALDRATVLKPFLEPFRKRLDAVTNEGKKTAARHLITSFVIASEDVVNDETKKELLLQSIEETEKKALGGDDAAFLSGLEQLNIDVERVKADKHPQAIGDRMHVDKEKEEKIEGQENKQEA